MPGCATTCRWVCVCWLVVLCFSPKVLFSHALVVYGVWYHWPMHYSSHRICMTMDEKHKNECAIRFSDRLESCYGDFPIFSRIWSWAEARVQSWPRSEMAPVVELPWPRATHACNALKEASFRPFVLRRPRPALTASDFLQRVPGSTIVHAIHLPSFVGNFSNWSTCSKDRRMQMNRYRLDEVLLSGKLYSSFEETIFDRKLEDDLGMTELKDGLCDWNHGFGGELFTGHIGEGEIGGTPLHSAGLGNFFRQLAGGAQLDADFSGILVLGAPSTRIPLLKRVWHLQCVETEKVQGAHGTHTKAARNLAPRRCAIHPAVVVA